MWPFFVIGVVLLVLLGWLGWSWAGDLLDQRAEAQSGSCHSGEQTLTVAVAPSMTKVIGDAAAAWTDGRPVILDQCLRAEIAGIPPQAVLDGLTGEWDTERWGARPGAWLPESSLWVNRVAAQDAQLLGSEPTSIATSPVLLAVPEPAAGALQEGSAFQWSDLPTLVSEAEGWAGYGQPDWGKFLVAMPEVGRNPASALALQAVLANTSPEQTGPVTVELLSERKVADAMTKLAKANPAATPATTRDALDAIAAVEDMAKAPFAAVPTLEFDLYLRNTGRDGDPAPAVPLVGMPVGGPTPTADFPFVAVAEPEGSSQVLVRAAQEFREFLQAAAQQRALAKAGLRVPNTKERPDTAPGIRWSTTTEELVPAEANATQQISAAWVNAGGIGQVVTVLVDVSSSMLDDGGGGKNRLDWVKSTLIGQVDRFGSGSLGLWVFAENLTDDELPYRQLAPTSAVAEQEGELREAIWSMRTDQASYLYPSLLAVYRSALNNHQPERVNRIIVITDGPNEAKTMDYEQFKRELDKYVAAGQELPISVIGIGKDVQRGELAELAASTTGRFAAAEDGTKVEASFGRLLSGG